nr:hypothetical protein [Tanacetum cinerariifolium]
GSESRPPMLNKENYVPQSSRLLRYAKSRLNGKLIHNSILNGPYVRRMIPEPGDAERDAECDVNVNETIHEQTDDELSERELKQIEADDQAIQTILLGLPKDIYAAVDKNFIKPKEQTDCSTGYEYGSRQTNADDWRNQVAQNLRVQNDRNQNQIGNGNLLAVRAEGNAAGHNGNQIRCYNYRGEEAGIQLQAEEYDLIAAAADLDEIEEVIENCILMANLQQASSLGTQTDSTPIYDFDGSAEVHEYENCYNNEIFNMFTQEEQYTELLKPILEPQQVPQNDNNVISEVTDVEQEFSNKAEKVNSVNRKLKETNADLTTELARFTLSGGLG